MRKYFDLYVTLAKISACAFGGGYAILPLLERELVLRRAWLKNDELLDMFAIAQCTPGVIAVNTATYVGARLGGFWGALSATLGVLTPPLLCISLLASVLWPYLSLPLVQHALAGLQVCVCALVLSALSKLFRAGVRGPVSFCLFLAAAGLSLFSALSPILIVLGAGLAGFLLLGRKGGEGAA